jgi:beta-glucosidase
MFSPVCRAFEASLIPVDRDEKTWKKVALYAVKLFQALLLALPALLFSFFPDPLPAPRTDLERFAANPVYPEGEPAVPFGRGVSTAEYQDRGPEGLPDSNWAKAAAPEAHPIKQPNFWDHPDKLINQLKDLGVSHYRFSIDWSLIQPTETGPICREALDKYKTLIGLLNEAEITPLVTLHHFVEPAWFAEKGGFTRKENIDAFVAFCRLIVNEVKEDVAYFATINEPTIYAFQGWVMKAFPPAKLLRFGQAAEVLGNLISAHVAVYEAIKEIYPAARVGITHDILRFQSKNRWFAPERVMARYFTDLTHTAFMRCVETGVFSIQMPLVNHTLRLNAPLRDYMDDLWVQFYSDPLISFLPPRVGSVQKRPTEPMSDYDFRVAPEDLATALQEAHVATGGKPVIISEIGTCVDDKKYPEARVDYLRKVFHIVNRAIFQGIRIPAVCIWTLKDNIEWHRLFEVRFGLLRTDEKIGTLTKRPVYAWLQGLIRANRGAPESKEETVA